MYTVTATYDRGLYTYFLDGKEFLRDIKRYTHATIYTRVHPSPLDGESVWVVPTKSSRQAMRKTITAAGGEFEGVVKIAGIFPN